MNYDLHADEVEDEEIQPLVELSMVNSSIAVKHYKSFRHPRNPFKFNAMTLNYNAGCWCKECLVYNKQKVLKQTKSPTQAIPIPTGRFTHIHVDLVGSLPSCSDTNMLFTITDRTTGWPEAIPLESASAKHCTELVM